MGAINPIKAKRPVAITKMHAAATWGSMDPVANQCSDIAGCEILCMAC